MKDIYIRQDNKIYYQCETGDLLLCGIIQKGFDCEFIQWFE